MSKIELVLVDTEPCGDFCEACTGSGCWCQTWEPRPVATPQKRLKGKEKIRLRGRAPQYQDRLKHWPSGDDRS